MLSAAARIVVVAGIAGISARAAAAEPTAEPAWHADVHLVFTVGAERWVALDDGSASDLTAYSRPVLFATDGVDGVAIAAVEPARLPEPARAWRDRVVVVGGACREQLAAFAYIGRATGDLAYNNDDHGHHPPWTPAWIAERGRVVLAARLSRCSGAFAQPAAAATAVAFERVTGNAASAAAAKARAALLASSFAAKAADDWREAEVTTPWTQDVRVDVIVARDPRNHATWVSARVHTRFRSGQPFASFWGLFRLQADGSLEQVALLEPRLEQINSLVDLDGDGTPELIGSALVKGEIALDAHGDVISELAVPWVVGCFLGTDG